MKNPRNLYAKSDEQIYMFCGPVCNIVARGDTTSDSVYANVTFYVTYGEKEPKFVSVMAFKGNGGIGVDHYSIAMKAEELRQSLTDNQVLYATIFAVKQVSPAGKVSYKARSTSFCVTEKDKMFTCKNPERVYFKPEQSSKLRIMSGYVTGVFPSAKYTALSFRADTTDKDAGFASVRCFAPYDETKAQVNNLQNSYKIAEMLSNGEGVHCVVACLEREFEGKLYYNAITTSFAVRKN